MARMWEGEAQEDNKGSQRSPQGVCQMHVWAQKCPRDWNPLVWHQWWEISSQWQVGMFWQKSFIYPSFSRMDGYRLTVKLNLQTALTDATEILYRQPGSPIPINLEEQGRSRQLWIPCSAPSEKQRLPQSVVHNLGQIISVSCCGHRSDFWVPQIPEWKVCFLPCLVFPCHILRVFYLFA